MLSYSGLSQRFWGEAMAVVRHFDPKLKTFGKRGIEYIFVGYAEHSNAFRFYAIEPNKSVSNNSIIESRDAIFNENRLSSVPRPSLRIPNGTKDIGGSVVPEEVTEEKSRIDYFDTYAPVARISTIRLMIALQSIHNLIIHQMDVKIAFLNVQVELTKEFLSSNFSMKDMGEVDVILGIRIKHESNEITISQSHYINKVVKKFNYFDYTPVSTPMDKSEKLMPNNGQDVSQLEYSRVIGCLMYVMTCTRPDIAFAVDKLSSYPSVLEGYTNVSWINNTKDNSSTGGWVFLLGGDAISWAFKKQTCIISSTMESEFMALAAGGKEAEWLRNMILEILLWSKHITPISILCDSVVTLAKAYSQMYNGKSRHLGAGYSRKEQKESQNQTKPSMEWKGQIPESSK
ncbi:zinc finger, CCHC-type containing protein [Tanacetum coccineum]